MEEFLEISFWKDCFLLQNLFQLLQILCFKNILGWKFLGKYHTILNCMILKKGIILTHRFYFLVAQTFVSVSYTHLTLPTNREV